jgi:hypothetical protein
MWVNLDGQLMGIEESQEDLMPEGGDPDGPEW